MVAKFFPDVLIFWAFIYAVAATAAVSAVSPPLRRLLHSALPFRIVPVRLGGGVTTTTTGEALVWAAFALTVLFSCLYWAHDHNWHEASLTRRGCPRAHPQPHHVVPLAACCSAARPNECNICVRNYSR